MADDIEHIIDMALLEATGIRMLYEEQLDRHMAEWQAQVLDRFLIDKRIKEARRG